jgi:hypothetical protein
MKKNLLLFIAFLAMGGLAFYFYKHNTGSTLSGKPLTEFAVEDTASINKIFIADHFGTTALLERIPGEKLWKLNGKYYARQDAINLLLETICKVRVRGNIATAAKDNIMKVLATSGKKVEIYTGGTEPAKIYYVGPATPDHVGTYMLLEIPGIGRSEEAYITHIEGFTGFLTPRFFADELEWRYTGVFSYPNLNLSEIRISNYINPTESFGVKLSPDKSVSVFKGKENDPQNFTEAVPSFDTTAVHDLILLFKKVHVESFNTLLKNEVRDSILLMKPTFTVEVIEPSGKSKKLDLFYKRAAKKVLDENGNELPWDVEHFWAKTPDNELALAQTYVVEPLVRPLTYYRKK